MTPRTRRAALLLGITLALAGALRTGAVRAAPADAARAARLVAEADALLHLKRPGEAIGVYRNALTLGANRAALDPRIAAAQILRRSLLRTCLSRQGSAAERACEAAWLPGAPDEVEVFKRRGALLQSTGASAAALDAYLAAARLAPKDRSVARAIVALAPAAGRHDAASLAAVAAVAAARDRLQFAGRALRGDAPSGGRAAGVTPAVAALSGPSAPPAAAAVSAGAVSAPAVPPATYSNEADATRSN